MPIAAILSLASGGAHTENCLRLAAELAEAFDAGLDIVHVALDPRVALPMVGEGMAAGMIQDVMERTEREAAERKERAETAAKALAEAKGQTLTDPEALAAKPGFAITWRVVEGSEADVLKAEAPYHDLLVLERPDMEEDAYATVCVEAALMETGRAVVLAPPGGGSGAAKNVAIAWDGSSSATRALAAAMPLLRKAESIAVLSVEESGKLANAESLAAFLSRHGLSAKAQMVSGESGDVGTLLLETAASGGADILVMGGYGHSRLREFIFGGVTESVLRSAGMTILMAH